MRRLRYEIARRINRLRGSTRWTHAVVGDRRIVAQPHRNISLRPIGSDLAVFVQVFERGDYSTADLTRHSDITARYRNILDAGKVPLIIDAGANVGLSALYFRDQYPDAQIVCLEPESDNFAELLARADSLMVPLRAALANFDGHVSVIDPGLQEWGFRTERADEGVPAYSLQTLLEKHEGEPFMLKVDIEGFEADIFDDPALLDQFYVVFLEPHDWMLPKQRTSRSFIHAVSELDRDFLIRGENILSVSNRSPEK